MFEIINGRVCKLSDILHQHNYNLSLFGNIKKVEI